MNEMDDQDNKSIASDFSILPEASEVEAMSLAQPFLAADSSKSSASGSYNQVEFVNVCSNYPASQDLLLYYRFVANHTPVVTDRLALYRVGFTSPQHYLVYEWAPRENLAAPPAALLQEGEQQAPIYAITFRKASLPRDAAEFYQVCYVSEEQSIRGVSSPFQLVQDGEGACSFAGSFGGASNDIVAVIEQADGSILVTSDLATLHSNIKMLQETVQQVREEKESVEQELTTVQMQLQGKQEQLVHLEQTIRELKAKADEERATSAEAVAAVIAKVQQAEQERNGLQEMLHQAREEVCRLQEETVRQREKENQLTELLLEREQRLAEYSAETEGQKLCLKVATNQLQALAQKQELLESELQQCVIQRDEARQQVHFWTEAASSDKNVVHQLQDKCHSANEELLRQLDALQAEQERAERAEDQIKATVADLETERAAMINLQELLKTCQQELQVSEERRKVLDDDNRSLQNNLRSLQTEADELQDELRESCSAREGAERVAEQLSARQQDVERQRAALEDKNKTLASKCSKLSKLILEQNVSESVEALIGLHDGDSTAGDDDDGNCVVGARTTNFGMFHGPATLTTATSSLAALDLSGSVDSRMNTMLEELLGHVRQLKAMMNARTDAAVKDAAPADSDLGNEDGTEDGLAISVVEVPGAECAEGGGAVGVAEVTGNEGASDNGSDKSVEATSEEDGTGNGGDVSVVEVASKVERCEQGRKVEEALAAAESAMEALMDHAKLLREVDEEKVKADPTVIAEANAETAAAEVLQEQAEEETEAFVDAPTRPSSTVINMESIPPEQTVEQQALQQQLSQQNVEPQPDLTHQPQESVTEPTPDKSRAQQQQQQPAPQHRPDPSCYYGPVFTSGQTAPVFFPQRSTNSGAFASGHSSHDSNSAGVGGHAFPPFIPPQFAAPIALPYPPIYPMPLPPSGFHPYPPPCSLPPPPPAPFHPMPPPPPVAPRAGPGLPPPLLPEMTEGARHAALLSTISAAAAQAIHNITSGLTPPASEGAQSSAPSSEADGAAPEAAAAAATGGSDDGGCTNRSTSSSTDTGFASNGRSGEAGSNNADGFHYNRNHMRWQYGGDGLNSSWGMGFAGNGEARAEVRHGFGGGYCQRFGNSTTEQQQQQQQSPEQDQQRRGRGMCTDFMERMNSMRDHYQHSRQMQHQACQMAQQAAQQQRMHMRAHRTQLREQCIRQREEQRNMVRGNAATFSNAAASGVANAATAASNVDTAVSNVAVAVSNAAAAVVAASGAAASALASAVNTTAASPAVKDVLAAASNGGAEAEQSQNLHEEDVEGDAPQQPEDEATQQQSSQETARRPQEADDGYLHCPMCQLKFGKTSSGLLEEHINSHLEFICPVCNTAYQRSQENEFTAHVETHFDDEDYMMPSAPSQEQNSSGTWERIDSYVSRFMETD